MLCPSLVWLFHEQGWGDWQFQIWTGDWLIGDFGEALDDAVRIAVLGTEKNFVQKEKFRWPCLAMLGVIFIIELISDIGTLAFFTVTALIIITGKSMRFVLFIVLVLTCFHVLSHKKKHLLHIQTVVFYIVMLIVTSIFFLFNGIRIVRLQKSASTQDAKTERKSKRLTRVSRKANKWWHMSWDENDASQMSTMIMVCSVGMFFLLVSFLTGSLLLRWVID